MRLVLYATWYAVRQATREAKNALFDLHPFILEKQGLDAVLKQYVNQLRHANKFAIHFKGIDQVTITDSKVSSAVFSIIHEAITNIERHANADNVWLSLESQSERFTVTIRDDGQGFDVNKINSEAGRRLWFGISNMQQRAALIEAKLTIDSRTEPPQRGTTIQLVLTRSST
jgi:two-component system sensor histidine kinase UhpB